MTENVKRFINLLTSLDYRIEPINKWATYSLVVGNIPSFEIGIDIEYYNSHFVDKIYPGCRVAEIGCNGTYLEKEFYFLKEGFANFDVIKNKYHERHWFRTKVVEYDSPRISSCFSEDEEREIFSHIDAVYKNRQHNLITKRQEVLKKLGFSVDTIDELKFCMEGMELI